MKFLHLTLTITTQCNQKCPYCDLWPLEEDWDYEINLEFVDWVLKRLPKVHPLLIGINGGEPGLATNLEFLLDMLNCNPKVHQVTLFSNGLLRKQGRYPFENSEKLIYWEHPIQEVVGNQVKYMYEGLELLKPTATSGNIMVATDSVIDSILSGDFPLNPDLFYFKGYFPKTDYYKPDIERHRNFFKSLGERYVTHWDLKEETNIEFCSPFPENPYIYIPKQEIGDCNFVWHTSQRLPCTKENVQRFLHGELFQTCNCPTCWQKPTHNRKVDHLQAILNGTPFNRTSKAKSILHGIRG